MGRLRTSRPTGGAGVLITAITWAIDEIGALLSPAHNFVRKIAVSRPTPQQMPIPADQTCRIFSQQLP